MAKQKLSSKEKAEIIYWLRDMLSDLRMHPQVQYPRGLTKDEFQQWFMSLKLPAKLGATQISEDVIVLRKIQETEVEQSKGV